MMTKWYDDNDNDIVLAPTNPVARLHNLRHKSQWEDLLEILGTQQNWNSLKTRLSLESPAPTVDLLWESESEIHLKPRIESPAPTVDLLWDPH